MKQKKEPIAIPKTYALVTGASQGLGKAMVLELAMRKINLLLVALPGEGVEELAAQLAGLGVEAHFYETDLSQRENVLKLTDWVNQNFNVGILINNAGRGGTRSMLAADAEYVDGIVQLNIAAPALITHQLLPNLLRQKNAYILNVSSMAAFSPIGFKTVYPASKRFIRHFSLGLRQELKGTGVSVSVVYPGPMKTNADVASRIEKQQWMGRIGLVSPEAVAEVAVRQMFRRKTCILAGWGNYLNWLLLAMLPNRFKIPLLTKAVRKEMDGLP
ncbi:MAG: SDR family NAD(P)-dependent oxidoreductase [Bacteroidetes bacterium]|nr:SDR family NAD(P)-dependent oxidoreductase [Bacteroidota bacterium]